MSEKILLIEISRAFNNVGFFKPQEVQTGFETGQFRSGDYGRYEDSGEWRPVEVIVAELKQRNGKAPVEAAPKAKKKGDIESIKSTEGSTCSSSWGFCCSADSNSTEPNGKRGFVAFIKEVIARF